MKKSRSPVLVVGSIGTIAAALALSQWIGADNAAAQVIPTYPPNQPEQAAQQQRLEAVATVPDQGTNERKAYKASEIIGLDVRPQSGNENVGSIQDLMISRDGRVEYVAVTFGGFLGVGDKLFAVPLDAITFEQASERGQDESYARIDVTDETLRTKKGFDKENWPQQPDPSFLTGRAQRQAERPVTLPQTSPQ